MAVPNIFGSATAAIPLSQLDTNFATPVTIGNTAVQLGNTVTSFGNVTLTNVTISSGNVTITGANVSGTANVSTLIITGNQTSLGNVSITGNVSANIATFGAGSNTAPAITTTGDTNTGIFFPAADTIAFSEGGVEAMRINSSGNVQTIGTISVGNATPSTSGAGITFPATQSASSDANTLDDYEEGTFTPTLTGVGGTPITYSAGASDAGYYTKVGNTVTVGITLNGTYTGGPPASFRVSQLPFVASSSANLFPTALIMNNNTGNAISSTGGWAEGTLSSIRVFGTWTSGQKYFVSCTYFV